MIKFIGRRILSIIPVLFGVSVVAFLLVKLVPGDFTITLLGPFATPEKTAALREYYGLNLPIYIQYFKWLGKVLHGDFGISIAYQVPVLTILAQRVANTLILTFFSIIFMIVFGFFGGLVVGIRQYSIFDRISTFFILIIASAPTFWLALIVLYFFSLKLGWFPAIGMTTLGKEGNLLNLLWHIPLPAASAGAVSMAVIFRLTRAGIFDVIQADFIRAARARGLPEKTINRHAARNIMPAFVNMGGLQVGFIFSASLFAEIIFQWPGVGLLMYNGILARDVPVIQAVLIVFSLIFTIMNLFSDIIQSALNPQAL